MIDIYRCIICPVYFFKVNYPETMSLIKEEQPFEINPQENWQWEQSVFPKPLSPLWASVFPEIINTAKYVAEKEGGVFEPETERVKVVDGYWYVKIPTTQHKETILPIEEIESSIFQWGKELKPEVKNGLNLIENSIKQDFRDEQEIHNTLKMALNLELRFNIITQFMLQVANSAAAQFKEKFKELTPEADDFEQAKLFTSINTPLVSFQRRVKKLAQLIKENPAMADALSINRERKLNEDKIKEVPGGGDWLKEFEKLVKDFEWFSNKPEDIMYPTLNEDHTFLIQFLKKELESTSDKTKSSFDLKTAKKQKLKQIINNTEQNQELQKDFFRFFKATQKLLLIREELNELIEKKVVALLRKLFLKVGNYLMLKRVVNEPSDIFFITLEELEHYLNNETPSTFHNLVEQRKSEFQKQLEETPHRKDNKEQVVVTALKGLPCSPGRAVGKTKAISSTEDLLEVQPGEIIILPHINISWAITSGIISGIITEEGGVLSHGSIVARELKIPTIIGVKDAIILIENGSMVLIDGEEGVINLL